MLFIKHKLYSEKLDYLKMTSTNIYWITGFSFLLLMLHLLYPVIFKYIDNKPNGVQSIFDLVIRDHFMIGRFNGTVYCVIAIMSSIDPIMAVITEYEILAIIMCSVYDFSQSGVFPSTRTLSFMMVSTFLALLVTTFSGLENQQDIYISRVFISVLVFFVLVPAFVIFKNEKIVVSMKSYVKSHHIFKILNNMNSIRRIGIVYPDVNI